MNNQSTKSLIEGASQVIPKAYDDLLHPAAIQLGTGLETVAKTLNIVLSPLEALVWGHDRIRDHLRSEIPKKLIARNAIKVVTPKPSVAVPALEALRYLGDENDLRDMFTNLLTSATNEETCELVHPAFVETIKQLSTEEAFILARIDRLKRFPTLVEVTYEQHEFTCIDDTNHEIYAAFHQTLVELGFPEHKESDYFLDNLMRLRLIERNKIGDVDLKSRQAYDLYGGETQHSLRSSSREAISVTRFGQRFLDACIEKLEVESCGNED